MPAPGRLHVGRFHADYVIADDHPAPEEVRRRLDHAARARMTRTLAHALAPLLDDGRDGVVLIRRLDVALDLDASADADRIAHAWAAEIARALVRAIAEGAGAPPGATDAGGVLRFTDRAAYLARFLVDLAAGDAWGRWYWAAFDGLRALSTSAAIRTAVSEDTAVGLRALLALRPAERRRVLERLSPNDARRLLDALAAGGADAAPAWDALRAAWDALPPHPPAPDAEARTALELWLRLREGSPAHGADARAGVRALVRLARLAGAGRDGARLFRALEGGDRAALYLAASDDAETLAPLLRAPSRWLAAVRRTLAPPTRAATSGASGTVVRTTPFGGIFLLLPFLDRLPLEDVARDWPAAGDTDAAAALRLLLLAKSLGAPRSTRVFWDPLARDLAAVAPSLSPALVRRWAARLPRHALAALLERLDAARRTRADEAAVPVLLADARLRGARAAVLLDARSGAWLWAAGHAAPRADRVAGRAAAWLESVGRTPAPLLADAAFADPALADPALADAAFGTARRPLDGVPVDGGSAARLMERDPRLAAVLARRDRLAGDLAHLAAPALGLPRPADLALSVAAQGMLRAFAARLPGFHASSLPYLFASFLDVAATVEVEPRRWLATLGRPPLQFVLALGGVARGEHAPGWLGGLTVACCQDGGG